jgi:hypothetical protein
MSKAEIGTRIHIKRVGALISGVIKSLLDRANAHDASKLEQPERDTFEIMTAKLAGTTYGSPEYKGFLAEMKPALDHHYANNRHHPEHYPNGIRDMTLIDVLEMLCDWKAASERHNDGNILKSIEHNGVRFNMSSELRDIMVNTVKALEWVK